MDKFPFDNLVPDWGLSDEYAADFEEIALGDGYTLRRPKGLNPVRMAWSVGYGFLTHKEQTDLVAWLKPRLNWKPFLWQHPTHKVWYKVIASDLKSAAADVGIYPVNFKLTEDFNP